MTATSSRTRSTSPIHSVVIALGSNRGRRELHLRRALEELKQVVRIVRISAVHETEPVDAPPDSGHFLNMVVAGYTRLAPAGLLDALKEIERRLGRVRDRRNAPRVIDLDIILYGAAMIRTATLTIPHPRYRARDFVMAPLRELALPWNDPVTGDFIR